jgi:hypothetical protein
MHVIILVLISLGIAAISPAAAGQAVLHEMSVDMDKVGTLDRAVLMVTGQGPVVFGAGDRHAYQLAEGEQADLLIFLNYGDGPLDLSKPPSLRKSALITRAGLSWVLPLTVTLEGALNIGSNTGFANTFRTTHTLKVIFGGGALKVANWSTVSETNRDSQRSLCSVNYLTGRAFKRKNKENNVPLEGTFEPIMLEDWNAGMRPVVCEEWGLQPQLNNGDSKSE